MNIFEVRKEQINLEEKVSNLRDLIQMLEVKENSPSEFDKYDILKLLKSPKYRAEVALEICETKVAAARLLGVSERTMYRNLKSEE